MDIVANFNDFWVYFGAYLIGGLVTLISAVRITTTYIVLANGEIEKQKLSDDEKGGIGVTVVVWPLYWIIGISALLGKTKVVKAIYTPKPPKEIKKVALEVQAKRALEKTPSEDDIPVCLD